MVGRELDHHVGSQGGREGDHRRPDEARTRGAGAHRRAKSTRAAKTRAAKTRGQEVIMFSRFFIDRPIFAAVLSIFVIIAGLASMRVLPVAQYPEIAPPVVTVQAVYPGASAQVLEQTVAAPLENQINGVERMLYMSSTS